MKKSTQAVLALAGLVTAVSASAVEPAVDAINGKLTLHTGHSETSAMEATLTAPVTDSLGIQVDLVSGNHEAGNLSAAAGHLFWRNPENAMVGVIGSWHAIDDFKNYRLGVEAEKFFTNFTAHAIAGYERSEIDTSGYSVADEDPYLKLKGSWYANENLALYAKLNHHHDSSPSETIGFEWQPGYQDFIGFSLYAELDHHDDAGYRGMFGIRFYLDAGKSLIKRHRSADPDSGYDAMNIASPAWIAAHSQPQGCYVFCS
ncbi:hypothetical protein [Halioxenophilus sp. WMMB6]|uniref:hypothetical protein n=1 Tax=Halioxenophilus sp. WMMB6 TaxID=3073815 RepID=UPI00295E8884|nr:hypothetical protein [Halioxenophilus sp. WMMB6]